ncbi:MAG: TonB-dependent receptor [Lentimicrobiaceae bacterium]|nr:TonB-dependent receptor [Lentimicrobiaceae bacterium]
MKYIQRQRFTALLLLLVLPFQFAFSQTYTLKGKIYDAEDNEPLMGATVLLLCSTSEGTVCDVSGNYSIQFKYKQCDVRFQYLGYETVVKAVSFDSSKTVTMDIAMKKSQETLNVVGITAKRDEITKDKSVSSVEVIKSKYITDFNITSLDNAFNQTGGLVIVNNEPQMRGGSGFSSGMGSRVMVMMDEMPVMRADAGRPAWNLIPMENIDQIEVLKGASSVLYGSSATTGAINVRTAYPKGRPQTKITLYNGFYSRPQADYRCSWEKGVVPLTYGASISHARKIKKFDLIFSGEYAHDDGFVNMDTSIMSKPMSSDDYKTLMSDSSSFNFGSDAYQKLVKEDRLRFNFGTRYRLTDNTSVGLNGIVLYSKNTMTHFWANADNGMYNVYPSALSEMTDFVCLLDPYFKYFGKEDVTHTFKGRYMYSDNWATNNQDSRSKMYYGEYQFAKLYKRWDLQSFAGAVGQFVSSAGNVFSGVSVLTPNAEPQPKYSVNAAAYLQVEKKFLKKKNLTALAGGRLEYSQICEKFNQLRQDDAAGNYVDMMPVFRAGVNYKIDSTYTSFRASFGQGYRFPTIGERYLTIKVGNYGFYPNPDLKAERSWNVEVGVNQLYRLWKIEGFVDVAAYYQRYNNYVEFFMGPWLSPEIEPDHTLRYGFKFFNTGPAKIVGIDVSTAGEAKIGRKVKASYYFAYTYCQPKVLDTNYVFIETASKSYNYVNTSSDAENQIMKYRLEHVLKADLSVTLFDCFSVGASAQYYSLMKNVDYFFYSMDRYSSLASRLIKENEAPFPFDGLENYAQTHNKGTTVYGLHTSVEMRNVKLSLIVSNLFNKEYSLRPMCPEAPRLTTLQLTYKFTEGEPFFPKQKKEKN